MTKCKATRHAEMRMAQRGIREEDLELAMWIGTEVEGGVVVREKDGLAFEQYLRRLADRVHRLIGKRVVVAGGKIVTAYHAGVRKRRQLLRGAEERLLED